MSPGIVKCFWGGKITPCGEVLQQRVTCTCVLNSDQEESIFPPLQSYFSWASSSSKKKQTTYICLSLCFSVLSHGFIIGGSPANFFTLYQIVVHVVAFEFSLAIFFFNSHLRTFFSWLLERGEGIEGNMEVREKYWLVASHVVPQPRIEPTA